MLDVHPPHSTTHTWRDFFIHIATIAVGLLIALGLEQTVEALHRHHERVHLIDDLRQEARGRVLEIQENNRSYLALGNWLQDTLHASLSATTAAGFVVFTLPPPIPPTSGNPRPATAVWTAAESSGIVSVLTREEIEDWERVDYFAKLAQRDTEGSQAALRSVEAVCAHLGAAFAAGSTVRTTPSGRGELTVSLGLVIESLKILRHDNEETIAATESVLNAEGATTRPQQSANNEGAH